MIKYLKNLEIFFDSDKDKKKYITIIQFAFLISAIFELGGIFLLGPLIFIATSGADSISNQYVSLAYNFIGQDFAAFFTIIVLGTTGIILLGGLVSETFIPDEKVK